MADDLSSEASNDPPPEAPASGGAESKPEAEPAEAPAAETEPAEAESTAAEPAEAGEPIQTDKPVKAAKPKKRRGSLRERLDLDRAAAEKKRAERKLSLGRAVFVLLACVASIYFARMPILRGLAWGGGGTGRWAVDHLARARDPGSFHHFVTRLGENADDSPRFHSLVYQLGGRSVAPDLDSDKPTPDDPEAVETHLAFLKLALASEEPTLRFGALRSLHVLHEHSWTRDPQLMERAAELLADKSQGATHRRVAALVLRGGVVPAGVYPVLCEASLADEDRFVRRFALMAVAASGAKSLGAKVLPALQDNAPAVRYQAQQTLLKLGMPIGVGDLRELYEASPKAPRDSILAAVAEHEGEDATRLLLQGLKAPDRETRAAALRGLRARPGSASFRGLVGALSDREVALRVLAADALANRGDGAKAVPALVERISEYSEWAELIRLHEALSALTEYEVEPPIQAQEESYVRVVEAWELYLERRG